MATIPAGLSHFVFAGAASVTLASASWKNNVRAIYKVNTDHDGWLSFKPDSNFPSVTQLVKNEFYLVDCIQPFDLPDAQITAGSSAAQLGAPAPVLSGITATIIKISFPAVLDAGSYTVKRSTNSDMSVATTVYTGSALSFTDTGLKGSTTYFYQVIASAAGFASAVSATVQATTLLDTQRFAFVSNSAQNTVIFQTDDIYEMMSFLRNNTISQPSTVFFNTDDTISLNQTVFVQPNNGNNAVLLKAGVGHKPVLDGNNALATLVQVSAANVTLEGLTLQNADPNANNGCIVRADSTRNCTLKNIEFIKGYCAVRATQSVYNLTIDGGSVDQVANGAFRIGDGQSQGIDGKWDLKNLVLKNIRMKDSLNNGNIPGTSSKNAPYLLLKRADGLLVDNITYDSSLYSGVGTIELSQNVAFQNVYCNSNVADGLYIYDTQGIKVQNYFYRAVSTGTGCRALYINTSSPDAQPSSNIEIYNSTMLCYKPNDSALSLEGVQKVISLRGNIFMGTQVSPCVGVSANKNNGHTPTIAADFMEEKENIFAHLNSDNCLVFGMYGFSDFYDGGYKGVYDVNDYKSRTNLGQGSVYNVVEPQSILFTSDYKQLTLASAGRNIVTAQTGNLATNIEGQTRTFPANPGAF